MNNDVTFVIPLVEGMLRMDDINKERKQNKDKEAKFNYRLRTTLLDLWIDDVDVNVTRGSTGKVKRNYLNRNDGISRVIRTNDRDTYHPGK
jgi:hypothetical protein